MSFTAWTRRLRDADPSLRTYGFDLVSAADGRAVIEFTVTEGMANPLGLLQGGFLFAAADAALGFAANSVIEGAATTDAHISYLAPGRVGDTIVAEAVVVHADAKRVFVDAFVRTDERVLAAFHGAARAMSGAAPSLPDPVGSIHHNPEGTS